MTSHLAYQAAREHAEQQLSRHLPVGEQAYRWHDGKQYHTGKLLAAHLVGNLSLVTSFGEVWLVPHDWLIELPIRKD